jgi:two-component system, NarL family, response regulator LiaR
MIRVLIVDDHSVVRQGLRAFLELDPELEIVGLAGDGAEGLKMAQELKPDVVLMDLLMPVMDGFAATAAIKQLSAKIEVLVLTSILDDTTIAKALRIGATGYLLKDTEAEEMCQAIKAAARGQVQLSPQAAALLAREVHVSVSSDVLTPREREVLKLIALGKANKEIANQLKIGEKTVKTHVSVILAKLGVQSRTQAALYAVQVGLVSPSERNQPA